MQNPGMESKGAASKRAYETGDGELRKACLFKKCLDAPYDFRSALLGNSTLGLEHHTVAFRFIYQLLSSAVRRRRKKDQQGSQEQ
jgi:hypothetical protein